MKQEKVIPRYWNSLFWGISFVVFAVLFFFLGYFYQIISSL